MNICPVLTSFIRHPILRPPRIRVFLAINDFVVLTFSCMYCSLWTWHTVYLIFKPRMVISSIHQRVQINKGQFLHLATVIILIIYVTLFLHQNILGVFSQCFLLVTYHNLTNKNSIIYFNHRTDHAILNIAMIKHFGHIQIFI